MEEQPPTGLKEYKGSLVGMIPPERVRSTEYARPSREVIRQFLELDDMTCVVSDVLDSVGIQGAIPATVLNPIIGGSKIAGPAITLRNIPERMTVTEAYRTQAKAKFAGLDIYSIAQPGDVIVIDAGGRRDVSNMGHLAALAATKRGMAGCIVNGAIRDVAGIRELQHPVWASGITPKASRYRTESAEINGQVECAGVQVNPGDFVLADDCGVVIVPFDILEEVLEKAQVRANRDAQAAAAILDGI
jgi:4-hydroxy-4-methyl-2-oxoglutarate aldolase